MLKKTLALFLGLMMILSLVACTGNSTEGAVKIEFLNLNIEEADIFEKIVSDFNTSQSEVMVKLVTPPDENVLAIRIQNNDSPDVFNEWFGQAVFDYVDSGYVRDLSDSFLLSRIDPAILTDTAYNGKNYMIPITKNFMGIYYNVDIFQDNNLAIPATLDELWAVCDTLNEKGITPFAAGYKDGWNLAHWGQNIIGNTIPDYPRVFKEIFNGDLKGVDINGISDFADVIIKVASYVQPDVLGTDTEASINEFVNGQTAMTINGSWNIPLIDSVSGDDFNYAIFPFPTNDAETMRVMSGADYSFLLSSKSSSEKQIATEKFVSYILDVGIEYYVEQTNAPSCVIGIDANTSKYELINNILEQGRIFSMPNSGRWTDETYLSYTVAMQNFVASGDKEKFYQEFEESLTVSGIPRTFID